MAARLPPQHTQRSRWPCPPTPPAAPVAQQADHALAQAGHEFAGRRHVRHLSGIKQ